MTSLSYQEDKKCDLCNYKKPNVSQYSIWSQVCRDCIDERERETKIKNCCRSEHVVERQITEAFDKWAVSIENADQVKCGCGCEQFLDFSHGVVHGQVKAYIAYLIEEVWKYDFT